MVLHSVKVVHDRQSLGIFRICAFPHKPALLLPHEEALQLRIVLEQGMEQFQGSACVLFDLRVGEADDPPALACDVVLSLDEVVEVSPFLELAESINFDGEFAFANHCKIEKIRANLMLGSNHPHAFVTQKQGQNLLYEMNL